MFRRLGRIGWVGLFPSSLCGVFLGVSSYTFYYAEGTSYLSSDPKACINCHIMREFYDGWEKGSHHNATCNDCHVPQSLIPKYLVKMEHGYRHSKGFTLQDFHEPIQIKTMSRNVVQDNCLRCHSEFLREVTAHQPQAVDCMHCHEGVGHGAAR